MTRFRFPALAFIAALVCCMAATRVEAQTQPSSDYERDAADQAIRVEEELQKKVWLLSQQRAELEKANERLRIAEVQRQRAMEQMNHARDELAKSQAEMADMRLANDLLKEQLEKLQSQMSMEIMAYHLRNVAADTAAKILGDAIPSAAQPDADQKSAKISIAVDERTNALIVRAPNHLAKHIASILQMVDKEPDPQDVSNRMLELQYQLPSDALHDVLKQIAEKSTEDNPLEVINSQVTQVFAHVAVRARPAQHKWLAETIAAHVSQSEQRRTLTLRAVWLMSDPQATPEDAPEFIRPVIAELEKQGISGMSVVAQAVVRAAVKEEFNVQSTVASETLGDQPCEWRVEGQFLDSNRLAISLGAAPFGQGDRTFAQIDTTLQIPSGQSVVLGVSPVQEKSSAFVIFVEE